MSVRARPALTRPPAPARRPPPGAATLPLAALRPRLDPASEAAYWAIDADGVLGRSLVMSGDSAVTFPLALDRPVTLRGHAQLLPHDWRDGRGAVGVAVTAAGRDGVARDLWTATLRAGDRGRPGGLAFRCRVPATTTALRLSLEVIGELVPGSATRAIWVEPALEDPHAPEPPAPTAGAPVAAADAPAPGAPGAPPDGAPAADTRAAAPDGAPLISVLTPVHDPPLHMLHEAIASVHAQTLTNWELCLIDDGSRDPAVIAALQHHADADPRIQLIRHDTPLGISAATNAGLAIAHGAYIATLDHDDTLTPDALATVAARITAEPDLDMLYSDEDTLDDDGHQISLHLKPAWSPDTLRTNGYTCHLGVYRSELVREIGGFRTEFNGSQDIDMILRLIERSDRVAHVPHVLYHWRAHAASTAAGYEAKPYAYVAARNAIAAHLQRTELQAEVAFGPPGLYRVTHAVSPETTVDLVLAVAGTEGLAEAAAGWLSQPHPSWRVVLAAPADTLDAAAATLAGAGLPEDRLTIIPADADADPATALAAAAAAATADHLLLMQAPAVGLTHDWLTRLLGYSNQPGIAAAGPILLAPDGRIHHAGIAIPDGIPLHLMHGTRSSMDRFFGYGTSVYNLSAVSGMLATSRAIYDATGGLHPHHRELTLVDYCLRATTTDQRTVIVPDARLRTTGPDPTLNDLPALRHLRHTWTTTHTTDPYYNPNYRTDRGDFEPVRR